jgi:hypothetical protein
MITQKEAHSLRHEYEKQVYEEVSEWCREHDELFDYLIRKNLQENNIRAHVDCKEFNISLDFKSIVFEAIKDYFHNFGFEVSNFQYANQLTGFFIELTGED